MDKFEKFIEENAANFDSNEPEDGHFERFHNKLNKDKKMKSTKNIFYWLKLAAVAVIVITLSVFSYLEIISGDVGNTANDVSLSDVSAEYKEVEEYYKTELETKITELNQLQCDKGSLPKDEIMNEFKSIDNLYNSLKKDLKKNQGNQQIINAMINCYQMKVEVLEQIINQVNDNC